MRIKAQLAVLLLFVGLACGQSASPGSEPATGQSQYTESVCSFCGGGATAQSFGTSSSYGQLGPYPSGYYGSSIQMSQGGSTVSSSSSFDYEEAYGFYSRVHNYTPQDGAGGQNYTGAYNRTDNATAGNATRRMSQAEHNNTLRRANLSLDRTLTQQESATNETIPPICGGTDRFCSVEYDSSGLGKSDCCNAKNNPVCAGCLKYCQDYCAKDYKGVSTCFVDDKGGPICQCTKFLPTCYQLHNITATTTLQKPQEDTTNPMVYAIIFGLALAVIIGGAKMAHKIG